MASLRVLALILAIVAAPFGMADAQTPPARPSDVSANQTTSRLPPVLEIVAVAGCAWVGALLARRVFNSGWFGFLGARMGAMLGLDALATLGLLGETAPAVRMAPAVPTWTI